MKYMKTRKYSLLLILLWETIRVFILFLIVTYVFLKEIQQNSQAIYWLVALGAPQMVSLPVLLFVFLNPLRYEGYVNALRIWKVINIFTMFLVLLNFNSGSIADVLPLKGIPLRIYLFPLTLMILFLDLIFFGLLISYRLRPLGPPNTNREEGRKENRREEVTLKDQGRSGTVENETMKEELPDFEEVEVSDDSEEG